MIKEFTAAMQANRAYPSSAPPLPYSLSSWITGFHGPRSSLHPSISGCLSKCPYIKTLPSLSPGISINIRGVLPFAFFIWNSLFSGACFFAHFTAFFSTFSIYPFSSQFLSKAGDLLGILIYSTSSGIISSFQKLSTYDDIFEDILDLFI